MAKAEPWRLIANHYPVFIVVPTRFSDLDTLGHVNNVAMAGVFETARVHFHHSFGKHPTDLGVRWMVAAVDLKFVAEAHFPEPVQVYSAVGHIGNSSWTVAQAAFQGEECVATCDTVMVMHGSRGKCVIGEDLRAIMQGFAPIRD